MRLTDGCAHEFRSRFTNSQLKKAKEEFQLDRVTFAYYEANEGKNKSDTTGAIAKQAFTRGICKLDEGVKNSKEIVQVIRSALKEQTKKFSFFIVREFPQISRQPKAHRAALPMKGIMSMHSITYTCTGLLAKKLSCLECSVESLYDSCSTEIPTVLFSSEVKEKPTEDELTQRVQDPDDDGATDCSDSDESDAEEDIGCGDIVWARKTTRSAYQPACVVSQEHVPEHQRRGLFRGVGHDKVTVQWYPLTGTPTFSRVNLSNVDVLAENRVDAARAAKSSDIHLAYELAIADVRGD